ncbi:hypothetical protein BH24CHL4_BH24CHL4_06310 [soil metagenome]
MVIGETVLTEQATVPDVGEVAPDFELLGAAGGAFRLSELRGIKRALLIFYPKDFTGG